MAFDFTPTDGLLNTTSFPQKPANQTNARQQFMTLFNQIKNALNSITALPTKSTVSLINGFTGTLYYWKDAMNMVHFMGKITAPGTVYAAFTMPAGYRPSQQWLMVAGGTGSTSVFNAYVGADGGGGVQKGSGYAVDQGTVISFDGLSYLAEQ